MKVLSGATVILSLLAADATAQSPEDLLRRMLRGQNVVPVPPSPQVLVPRVPMDPEVAAMQAMLNAAGFNAGRPDGVLGPGTRQAIMAYQRSIGTSPTGRLTPAQLAALSRGEAGPAVPAPSPQPTTAGVDIAAVQRGLSDRGYDVGVVDGIWGPRSQRALDAFRQSAGLSGRGRPTPADLSALSEPPTPEQTAAATPDTADTGAGPAQDLGFQTAGEGGAALVSLPVVDRDKPFRVLGTGLATSQDRMALVPGGAAPHAGTPTVGLVSDAPVTMTAPAAPGVYDILWISHLDGSVLVRRAVEVR